MRRLATLASLALAIPALAFAQPTGLPSFVPQADAVFVQQYAGQPDLGNARVILVLGSDEQQRLKDATGQSALVPVGPFDQQVVFRDDGEFGDAAKEDGEYTAVARLDLTELAERSTSDRTVDDRGENVVPVFEGRAKVGTTEVTPFDFQAFQAGALVPVERSFSLSGSVSPPQNEEGSVRSTSAAVVTPGTNQFQDRVLMIRDAAVVEDPLRTFNPCFPNVGTPMGPWTFGHLATEMANQAATGINPSDFVETWLLEWSTLQTINSFNVPSRQAIQALISDWRAASGGGDLDLSIAPFRLLAINPRLDLRTTTGGGGTYSGAASGMFLDAGEARFTFGVVLPKGYDKSKSEFILTEPVGTTPCRVTRFSVIFEYRVPKCKCEHVREWAREWIALNGVVPGTNDYNGRLEKLTRTFTDANANPTRPNGSAIGQVRSNEISLEAPWEIREFQLGMMPWAFLLETTTNDTPADVPFGPPANNSNTFGNFVLDVAANLAGPKVPLFYPLGSGNNFLGANPQTINPFNTFWDAPNVPNGHPTRFQVSIGTCNGCHARETNTVPKPGFGGFQHIESFQPAPPAVLSQFLTGTVPAVPDPTDGTILREFDDLERREIDINAVAQMICGHIQPVLTTAVRIPPVGPLRSDGGEVLSRSAAATSPDPDAPALSVAIEDFLREPVLQVH